MLIPIGIYSSTPGMGKTTIAQWLAHAHGYEVVSFATPIKAMARTLLKTAGLDDVLIDKYMYVPEWKNTVEIPGLGATMRDILQTLGTDWGRQINKDIWINIALERGKNLKFGGICVDDMRFPNEYDRMSEEGVVIRVRRDVPDYSQNHASEKRLDDMSFHYDIENNYATVKELYEKLDKLFPPDFFVYR